MHRVCLDLFWMPTRLSTTPQEDKNNYIIPSLPFSWKQFDFSALLGRANIPMSFSETYRCYSVAMCEKTSLESGDKIVLPPKTLEALTRFHVQFPMLFRLENPVHMTVTHVGVSEFSAPEGRCFVPHWVRRCIEFYARLIFLS